MPKTEGKAATPSRADGRKPMMIYMAPETIRELKKAALDEERNAYEIVEECVNDWLVRTAKRRRKS